jgi:hypothetical protein
MAFALPAVAFAMAWAALALLASARTATTLMTLTVTTTAPTPALVLPPPATIVARSRLQFAAGEVVRYRNEETAVNRLEDYYNLHAINRGEEGLVVKDLGAPYLLGDKGEHKSTYPRICPIHCFIA